MSHDTSEIFTSNALKNVRVARFGLPICRCQEVIQRSLEAFSARTELCFSNSTNLNRKVPTEKYTQV